jgi:SH3-like domain-containing protein
LAEKRSVIVRAERAQVRAAADDKAALVFEAERDVVLELLEAVPGGWAKVSHRDGQSGFLKAPQVWGL